MTTPLDGIRVLELNRVAPGSLCTMMLGDMGAEVLRLETPPRRGGTKAFDGGDDDTWALSEFANRNKRSINLDLKDPRGQQVLHALAADFDVVVEGFRPMVTARLGADYATLGAINPRLVYCSLSGFGQDGPDRDRAGHDLNYLAIAGVLGQLGSGDGPPPIPLNLIADYAGASLHGVIGILLALLARDRTGRGQHVDVAYLDTAFALLMAVPGVRECLIGGAPAVPGGNVFAGEHPYYSVYRTRDARWLSVGCMEPWLWDNFCDAVGRADLKPARMRHADFAAPPTAAQQKARRELVAVMRTRTLAEWKTLFADIDVCIGEVNDIGEALADPQLRARGMVVARDDPRVPGASQPGIAIKLSDTPGRIRTPPPVPGADTDAVLRGLGYDATAIAGLRDDGVI